MLIIMKYSQLSILQYLIRFFLINNAAESNQRCDEFEAFFGTVLSTVYNENLQRQSAKRESWPHGELSVVPFKRNFVQVGMRHFKRTKTNYFVGFLLCLFSFLFLIRFLYAFSALTDFGSSLEEKALISVSNKDYLIINYQSEKRTIFQLITFIFFILIEANTV